MAGWTKISTGTLSPLNGKKLFMVGDSITSNAYASRPYPTLVGEKTGATVNNRGISGWRMQRMSGQSNSVLVLFEQQLTSDYDIITNATGVNDAITTADFAIGTMADRVDTTFYGAYHNACLTTISKCPGKKYANFTLFPNGHKGTGDQIEQNCLLINQAIKDVSGYYGIPVFDSWNNCGLPMQIQAIKTAYSTGDALHLNNAGHEIVASPFTAFLEGLYR